MAVGVGWGDPVHRCGIFLSGVKRRRELGNFRATVSYRYPFSIQLDIQGTAEYAIAAAQHSVHLTGGILRHFWAFSTPKRNPAPKPSPRSVRQSVTQTVGQ